MRCKPVIEISAEETSNYEYFTMKVVAGKYENKIIFLGSNSLNKLKKEIKNRHWHYANIETNIGCFAYAGQCVDIYTYCPRY